MDDMNHLSDDGTVHMVSVGEKAVTNRSASAIADVSLDDSTRVRLFGGDLPKGDALATVRIAAIQATKRTPELIPLCHPLQISGVEVSVEETEIGASVGVTVTVDGKTGVEMEAMTGAAVGALTLYDMVKGIDRSAEVVSVRLVHKRGGRSGEWVRG